MYYIIIKSPGASTFFLKSLAAVEIFHLYPGIKHIIGRTTRFYGGMNYNLDTYCLFIVFMN